MLKSKNKLLHKAIAFVLTFSLLATLVSFNFTASASETEVIIINTPEDLINFATNVNNGTYVNVSAKLGNDNITVDSEWTPIGNKTNKFTGVFDGNGKTITFNSGISDGEYVGLFGINDGTIKNVTVEGKIDSSTETAFIGGIAGLNRGIIKECTNNINITAAGFKAYAGGIAGVMTSGTIDTCKNNADINVNIENNDSTDVTDHEAAAGGIVAFNYNGTVKKSTNEGNVFNNETYGYTGGIVGNNDGIINNCLNSGSVTNDNAGNYVGGIAGNLFTNSDTGSTATISNCLNTNNSGEVVGTKNNGTVVENSYYTSTESGAVDNDATSVTSDQLTSGEVVYKLNGNTAADPIWGQTIGENPVIGANSDNTVYKDKNSETYTNTPLTSCSHEFTNGACPYCGLVIARVSGYTITLKGEIGLNFYFDIKNGVSVDGVTVTLTKDKKNYEKNLTLVESDSNYKAPKGYTGYYVTIAVDSDQMNIPVQATVNGLTYENAPVNLSSDSYTVDKYLNTLYTTSTNSKLQTLVSAMATYGYWANLYFGVYESYEPSVNMIKLTATSNSIDNNTYKMSVSGDAGTLTHYATSLQHLETITSVFYVTGNDVTPDTVMQYTQKSISSEGTTSEPKYVPVTKSSSGGYWWAATDKILVSKLKDTKFEVTFGIQTEEGYTPLSNTKTFSPYGYIRTILSKYETKGNTTDSSYKLAQALYHYSEAAADYFPSQNS